MPGLFAADPPTGFKSKLQATVQRLAASRTFIESSMSSGVVEEEKEAVLDCWKRGNRVSSEG